MAKATKKSGTVAAKKAVTKKAASKPRKAKSILVFSVQDRNEYRRKLQDYIRSGETTVQERNALRRKMEADFKAARNQG